MTAARLHGVIAMFGSADALADAVMAAQRQGYTCLEAFSPFPLRDLATALGVRTAAIPRIAAAAGLVGAAIQFGTQDWLNAIAYPLNVGGRPLHSWPAFLPATLIVGILWAAVAALLSLLVILRLPRLHHPLFAVPGFERASEDRFFLLIASRDPRFERQQATAFLATLAPLAVQEVAP